MSLFGRQVSLQIGQAGTTGRSITGLSARFRVSMSRSTEPNRATIIVTNLAPTSRALLQEDGCVVQLIAGYDVPRMLFQGNPVKGGVRSERRGPDRITTIEAEDGGREIREAFISVSFATETTLRQVLDEVGSQLGLPEGTIRVDTSYRFPHGVSLQGQVSDVLDRVAQISGAGWFIRDGTLQIVADDEDTGETAVVFSVDQGNLIGSPTPTDDGIEIVGLLEPSIRPGRLFQVQSEDYDGVYIADEVEFVGGVRDSAFYVKVRGVPR